MKWPLPLRFAIPLMLLLFAGTARLIALRSGRQQETRNLENRLRERAEYFGTKLSSMSAYFFETNNFPGAQRMIALAASDRDLRLALVFNESNRVLFSSRYDLQNRALKETPAAGRVALLDRARATHTGQFEFSPDRGSLFATFPFPITPRLGGALRDVNFGVVFLDFDLTQPKAVMAASAARRLWFGNAVLFGLCVIFSLLFGPLLTSRVRRLAMTARQLASGDLTARTGLRGHDELAELARAFDQMAADLQRGGHELHESEARFRFLVEGIPQVFWLDELDPYRPLYVGPAFEKVWGRSREEFYARPAIWHEAIHPDDRERARQAFTDWTEGRASTYDVTYRVVRPDGGESWIRNRGTLFEPDPGGRRRVVGIAEDITEQHRIEGEQDELENKLRETQKLESLGVLAGGIAHDFNNLLAGILGNASLARQELTATSSIQPYLEQIESASLRAAELCKQMLAYSGKGRFHVQHIDLSGLVRETMQLIQLTLSKNAVLRFNLTDSLPSIDADPTQIRQVIMNLVINASEAIGGKSGVVCVNTGLVRADHDYLEKAVLSPDLPIGDYVFLEVSDTGCGMSPETQTRIFEPFFTTKFTGRGLGLSAVLGIVRGHRGAMRVYSEEGRGTTFKLIFPAAEGDAEPIAAEEIAEIWKGSGTVLVVDDDPTVRAVAARMVEKFGFKPIIANDGREGVDKFREHRSEIVAVLMDLTMPHLDGEQAFRELRVIDPKVRVVLMSGFNEQEAINRFTGKGLAGFIQKPFKPDALRKKLKDALESA